MTSVSTDRLREIAADSVMYVCADCERAENHEAMCHNFDFVSIIGGEVICNSCADDGHNGEPRLPVPNLALALRASKPEVEKLIEAAETLRFNAANLIAEEELSDALQTLDVAREVMRDVADRLDAEITK